MASKKTQLDKFKEAARKLEADESKDSFAKKLKMMAPRPKEANKPTQKKERD